SRGAGVDADCPFGLRRDCGEAVFRGCLPVATPMTARLLPCRWECAFWWLAVRSFRAFGNAAGRFCFSSICSVRRDGGGSSKRAALPLSAQRHRERSKRTVAHL